MNNKFDELTKSVARSLTRRGAIRKFGVRLVRMALAFFLTLPAIAAGQSTGLGSVFDPAGDAEFPYDVFDGPIPPYLDAVEASISSKRGVFRFEIKVNSTIPENADPGWTPSVNHFGLIFGISTDPKSAGLTKFFGQRDRYYFNFLVGAVFFAEDDALGLGLGWRGFIAGPTGFQEIPLKIRGDTFVFETSADSLDNPTSFNWVVGSHCSPKSEPDETKRTTILVDYAPDHGLVTWIAP
jgi:hypothetical protein